MIFLGLVIVRARPVRCAGGAVWKSARTLSAHLTGLASGRNDDQGHIFHCKGTKRQRRRGISLPFASLHLCRFAVKNSTISLITTKNLRFSAFVCVQPFFHHLDHYRNDVMIRLMLERK
jgi:hypothetical protein